MNNQNIFFKGGKVWKSMRGPPWITQSPTIPRTRVKAKPQINYLWSMVPWCTKHACQYTDWLSHVWMLESIQFKGKILEGSSYIKTKQKEHVVHWDQEQQRQQKALQVRVEFWNYSHCELISLKVNKMWLPESTRLTIGVLLALSPQCQIHQWSKILVVVCMFLQIIAAADILNTDFLHIHWKTGKKRGTL